MPVAEHIKSVRCRGLREIRPIANVFGDLIADKSDLSIQILSQDGGAVSGDRLAVFKIFKALRNVGQKISIFLMLLFGSLLNFSLGFQAINNAVALRGLSLGVLF